VQGDDFEGRPSPFVSGAEFQNPAQRLEFSRGISLRPASHSQAFSSARFRRVSPPEQFAAPRGLSPDLAGELGLLEQARALFRPARLASCRWPGRCPLRSGASSGRGEPGVEAGRSGFVGGRVCASSARRPE